MPIDPSIDLKFGSPLHKRVLDALDVRFRLSGQKMNRLHKKWKESEEQHIAYLPETEVDAKRRLRRDNEGKPQYTTIVLPYTYAMLMSAHSYWTTVFLSRQPVFQYAGRHGEAEDQVLALEALIDYQMQVGRMLVPLYFWLLDAGKFGIGLLVQYWDEEMRRVTITQQQPIIDPIFGMPTGEMRPIRSVQSVRGYCGSKVLNLRPYDYYPDPRVPLWNPQAGEFVGYVTELILNDLLRGKASGQFINVDEVRNLSAAPGTARMPGSSQLQLPNDDTSDFSAQDLKNTGPYGTLVMYVDLVAKEWGLGEETYPEKWVFQCLVENNSAGTGGGQSLRAIFQARPLGALHQKFPISVLEMEPEPYAFASRGMPEVMRSLQQSMDWLINSHMYNVRQTLNDQFVVDPSRIVMQDYMNGGPGKAIRLKPAAYGTDPKTAISQLPVQDVTRGHISDIMFLHEFSQRAVGVNDQIMGMLNAGGRKTAQEVRTSSSFGVNRQKTTSELYSAMGFGPLAELLVLSSQQYYDQELKLRIVGDQASSAGQAFMTVTPEAIAGNFDFVPVDGTMPIDRYQQANLWREIILGMRQVPEVMMQYDFGKIFAWVAQLAGLKNINRFRVAVAPDQMLLAKAQAGNVIPMKGSPLGATSPEPGQISGMGTSG